VGKDAIPRTELVRRGRKVQVEQDDAGVVTLVIDGHDVEVEIVDGKYFSHLAGMFEGFDDLFALVDSLMEHEGTLWSFSHAHHPHPHPADRPDGGHH